MGDKKPQLYINGQPYGSIKSAWRKGLETYPFYHQIDYWWFI
ncbi:uncharacterized protein J3R85_021091 [Psidium guajava]|nr:uncharacterized protein J3R85_021091 [Psidium guajava]